MTSYKFGDVVLVSFPFTDQTITKKRPAIVVSSAGYNRQRPDLIIMAVTSQMKPSASFGEVLITQWKQAGLIKPSVIKPICTTVEKTACLKEAWPPHRTRSTISSCCAANYLGMIFPPPGNPIIHVDVIATQKSRASKLNCHGSCMSLT